MISIIALSLIISLSWWLLDAFFWLLQICMPDIIKLITPRMNLIVVFIKDMLYYKE